MAVVHCHRRGVAHRDRCDGLREHIFDTWVMHLVDLVYEYRCVWNDRTSSWRTWWLPVWSHLSSSSLTLARRLSDENWPNLWRLIQYTFLTNGFPWWISLTLIAVRGHYPRSAHPAYAECGQGLEVWKLQLWAYMLHDCLQTDTCVSQMFVRELRSWGHTKSHILESSGATPYVPNSRCSTFAAAEAKTLTTTSVYTPPEVKAKTAVPFSEVLRSIFSMGFWPCSCPWHGRNKDVRFFWLRESNEVFLLILTSCHWYVLEDNRQQG